MRIRTSALAILAEGVLFTAACAQEGTNDPFPTPISQDGAVVVDFVELATIPPYQGATARMMTLVTQPGTLRMFVSDMAGPIYSVSYDGRTVMQYVDVNEPRWGVSLNARSRELGVQSIAFHPDFNEAGRPGFGKFYTWLDTSETGPTPDYTPAGGGTISHHTVLYEWTARTPGAPTYDGDAPRELLRLAQPFANHNGGGIGFNPLVEFGNPEYGLLYVGVADGGSGGDPMNHAQNLGIAFGKILRIDPLGTNSRNGKYGIPADNPFVDGDPNTLDEIWAYGVRNPQRFTWDPATGNMFMSDIGQNVVEKVSLVPRRGNLGWNTWEGSFRFLGGRAGVSLESPRSDPSVTYPVAEYDQTDPLLQAFSAATGVHVFRNNVLPRLNGMLVFGDMPSGEVFFVPVDPLPQGGQDRIRRVLFNDGGTPKTFLQLVREEVQATGQTQLPTRADMRFGYGPNGQLLLINKYDGVIRLLVPGN